MTKSKNVKNSPKIDFEMVPKILTLLSACFWIIAMHSFCHCSLPIWRSSPLEKGSLIDQFLPHPGSTPGRGLPKSLTTSARPLVHHPYQVSLTSIKRFCSKGWLCFPIHIHALVQPPPFLHLNKYIKKSLKILKHLIVYITLLPLINME